MSRLATTTRIAATFVVLILVLFGLACAGEEAPRARPDSLIGEDEVVLMAFTKESPSPPFTLRDAAGETLGVLDFERGTGVVLQYPDGDTEPLCKLSRFKELAMIGYSTERQTVYAYIRTTGAPIDLYPLKLIHLGDRSTTSDRLPKKEFMRRWNAAVRKFKRLAAERGDE